MVSDLVPTTTPPPRTPSDRTHLVRSTTTHRTIPSPHDHRVLAPAEGERCRRCPAGVAMSHRQVLEALSGILLGLLNTILSTTVVGTACR